MAIEVNEFIESGDINAIINKFNKEADRRQPRIGSYSINDTGIDDDLEILQSVAGKMQQINEVLHSEVNLLSNVTEDRCQPFNATVLTDAETNLLNKDIIRGDTEINATFAQTLDKSVTGLSNQSTTAVLNEQGTLEANTESFESYTCSCNVVGGNSSCSTNFIDCNDCFLCTTKDEYCGCYGYKALDCSCLNTCSCEEYNCTCHSNFCNDDDVCEGDCESNCEGNCETNCNDCQVNCGCDGNDPDCCDTHDCGMNKPDEPEKCIHCDVNCGTTCSCDSACNDCGCYEYDTTCCDGDIVCCDGHMVCCDDDMVCEPDTYSCGCYGNGDPTVCACNLTSPGTCTGECTCHGEFCSTTLCTGTQLNEVSYTSYSITGEKSAICNCDSVCSDFYNVNPFNGDNKGYLVCIGVSNKAITLINMIANGNLSHDTVGWEHYPNRDDRDIGDKVGGYRAFRSFKIHKETSYALQYLDSQFIPNHTYYFSAWCKAKNKVTSDFSIFLGLGDGGTDLVNYFTETETPLTKFTDTDWKLLSFTYKYTKPSTSSDARFSIWATNNPNDLSEGSKDKVIGNNVLYMSRFILVDLTKHFGEGKEPNKDWCDNNTKEHHTFVNLDSKWAHENGAGALWTPDNEKSFNFKHTKAVIIGITPPEFADYMYSLQGKAYVSDKEPNLECYLKGPLVSQEANLLYYISYDAKTSASADKNLGTQVYWGGDKGNHTTTEPPMGASIPLSTTWKKISFLNGRPFQTKYTTSNIYNSDSYEEATYQPRIDFDSNKTTEFMDVTNISCIGLDKNLEEYNKQEKKKTLADIKRKDINIHWCDRWLVGENSTFIHIGDPSFTKPIFKDGRVSANDIIIKPETNTITVDNEKGTITCKKLIIL